MDEPDRRRSLLPADNERILAPPPAGRRGAGGPPPLPESGLIGPFTVQSRSLNRVTDSPDGSVANIPVNYTEAKTGRYTFAGSFEAGRRPAIDAFPPAGQIVGDRLAYYMHAGGHGMVPGD